MDRWPEFVVNEEKEKGQAALPVLQLTGWESVVFEIEDVQDGDSFFSTAAMAP